MTATTKTTKVDENSDHLPQRLLMGPGPSNLSPRVVRALTLPVLGISDPKLFDVMDEIQDLLRYVFFTKNKVTFPLSSTGMSGMEASVVNLVEPGEEFVVLSSGFFGERMAEIGKRVGAKVIELKGEWGTAIQPEVVEKALSDSKAEVVGLVHGETSTGAVQPVGEITKIASKYDALCIVDTVASLGGVEFKMDAWDVDICYTGSQKCLGAPPGLSPISISDRAFEKISNRRTEIPTFYFDLTLLCKYWSRDRVYHHTPPSLMLYALREALRAIREEGLEEIWKRHLKANRLLHSLFQQREELRFEMFADPRYSLPTVVTPLLPKGVVDSDVRRELLNEYNIEVGVGVGKMKGKMLRIGVMGENARAEKVTKLVEGLTEVIPSLKKRAEVAA
jgi:alanine-glyoxylate transaminase/serine-glyoxylate transaminase/serine-pyruvate transaminase